MDVLEAVHQQARPDPRVANRQVAPAPTPLAFVLRSATHRPIVFSLKRDGVRDDVTARKEPITREGLVSP